MSESVLKCVKVGQYVIAVEYVAAAHWDKGKLYVYLAGGRFLGLKSPEADLVWKVLVDLALDLETGAVKEQG